MSLEHINLISFGYFEKGLLKMIVQDVEHEFSIPVLTREGHLDLSEFYDPARRQYNGFSLLKVIDIQFSSEASKTIGLFDIDLYIPILTYIFGQAYLNGKSGIASIFRLRNERYGIRTDDQMLVERFRKRLGNFGIFNVASCNTYSF